jgi:hypothetical protein
MAVQNGRCVSCRSDISVPDTYAQGDHIKCAACGTRHKVQRGDTLRLVLADLGPIRDALRANDQLVSRLRDDVRATRMSFGAGLNGIFFGLGLLAWRIGYEGQLVSVDLVVQAVAVAVGAGVVIEVANYLFLAKRARLSRLAAEIREAEEEGRRLDQRIREAGRV